MRTTYNSPPLFCFNRKDSRRDRRVRRIVESRILITRIHSRFRREYIRCTELYSTNHISPLFRIDRKDSIERNLRNPFAEDEGTRRWTELRIRPV